MRGAHSSSPNVRTAVANVNEVRPRPDEQDHRESRGRGRSAFSGVLCAKTLIDVAHSFLETLEEVVLLRRLQPVEAADCLRHVLEKRGDCAFAGLVATRRTADSVGNYEKVRVGGAKPVCERVRRKTGMTDID